MGITIKGLSSLQYKLKKLDPITHNAAAIGVSLAGMAVEGTAKNTVPVKTGELKGSINGRTQRTANGATATVGTNKEYASHVEFGTSRQAAQPYLQPSLQKNKDKARKIIINEIVKAHRGL